MKYFYPVAVAQLRVIWQDFGSSDPALTQPWEIQVTPKQTRVSINSYVEADTFDIELDYKTFPFDPRAIKSCQVNIYMENQLKRADMQRNALVPSKDNAIFSGFADEDSIDLNESARTVRLKGRDFTAILIDAKWPGKLLSMHKPADQVIAGIISKLPAMGDVRIDNRTGIASLPVLAGLFPDLSQLAGMRSAQKHEKYWDVIQDICARIGIIAYMELDKLVLAKPRTLYDPTKSVQLVYGKNIKSMDMTRKFGRQKGFNLVVRSIRGKEVIKAEIPKDSTTLPEGGDYVRIPVQTPQGVQINKMDPSSIAPTMSFVVSNVGDKKHLIEVGEKIYEEIGRQQIEGKIKTLDMDSPQNVGTKQESCFDLLQLRVGTPLSIVIGSDDLANITKTSDMAKRTQYLMMRGYNPKVATVFAQTLGKFVTPFYTKGATFSLDENGFGVEIDYVNFIETAGKGLGIL